MTEASLDQDVTAFHKAMGQTVGDLASPRIRDGRLRIDLIEEEALEFREAVEAGDLVKAADAIGDLIYVSVGAAVTFGLDMNPIWAEIQRSNMNKATGPVRDDGKRLK